MIEVDVTVLTFVAGSILPLLTGLLTKLKASSKVKSLMNLGLSLVGGAVAYLVAHNGQADFQSLFMAVGTVYLASGTSYNNLWKPTGVAERVQNATANIGVGKVIELPEPVVPVVEEVEEPVGEQVRQLTTLKGTPVYVSVDGVLTIRDTTKQTSS